MEAILPINVYKCNNGHKFECLQPYDAAPPTQCPVCKDTNIWKLVTAASFKIDPAVKKGTH